MPPAKRPAIAEPTNALLKPLGQSQRDAVLLAAVRLFNERGFAATSLDDVAAQLNVTKPIIYRHFANKDQVLFECVRIGLDEIIAAADGASQGPGDAAERLLALVRCYALIMTHDFGMCVTRTGDHELAPQSRKEFRALKRKIDCVLRDLIKAGIKDGSIGVDDARMAGFAVAGALNWIGRWFKQGGSVSAEDVAKTYVRLCANMLKIDARRIWKKA